MESIGDGIKKFTYDKDKDYTELYNELFENNQLLIEEWINQHPDLDKLYSGSVNTMRMFTLYKDGKAYFLYALLKMGNR